MNTLRLGGAHIVSGFDEDIATLFGQFDEMRTVASRMLGDAMTALCTKDEVLADEVVQRDRTVDELQVQLESGVVRVLARRSPVAEDLRTIITLIKAASILERIGDHAKNIAKRVRSIDIEGLTGEIAHVERMATIARKQIELGVRALMERDAAIADEVDALDDELDDAFDDLTAMMVRRMSEESMDAYASTHILFIGKQIERSGDHGVNIARAARYIATGEHPRDQVDKRTLVDA